MGMGQSMSPIMNRGFSKENVRVRVRVRVWVWVWVNRCHL